VIVKDAKMDIILMQKDHVNFVLPEISSLDVKLQLKPTSLNVENFPKELSLSHPTKTNST
jgi:hypothetical protein